MFSKWTQHLETEEEKEKFRNEIYSSERVLKRLSQMIEEDLNSLDRSERDQRIYDLPNWDYRQAHKNGNRQTYQLIKDIINLDQKDKQ